MDTFLLNADEKKIISGLGSLFNISNRYSSRTINKPIIMFEDYYLGKSESSSELWKLEKYYLEAWKFKFYIFNLSLEQLWALSMNSRSGLFEHN